MRKHFVVRLALVLLALCPIARSQNPSGEEPVDCADPLYASSEQCRQNDLLTPQQGTGQQIPGEIPENATGRGAQTGRISENRTTSAGTETAPIGGRTIVRPQETTLPPDLPTEFQKFVAATTGQILPIYGANLFRNVPSTFSPSNLSPVTPEYVIGPDDELRIRIWGQITYSGNLRVDRSGNIYLPQAGTVHVAGLQYSALDQRLRAAVGKMYRNFDLSVDVGRIRSMQIYVTGQARRPGAYTVSSLSSLVDALFASGGPSPQGSLRHIQVKRDGKTITDFDLYGLLVRGDKSKDVRLLPEDVLYIPPAGSQVAVTGSVRVPGIYELQDSETIGDILQAAGKTTAMSSKARISLERTGQGQLREAMEFKLDAEGLGAQLADGDILRIFPIVPAYEKTVTLRGNVANPGRFSLRPGMHLSDLIPDRDSLVSRDYWWKRSHLGLPVPEFEPLISNLGREQRTRDLSGLEYGREETRPPTDESLTAALTASGKQQGNEPSDNEQSAELPRQGTDATRSETPRASQTASSGTLATQLMQRPAPGLKESARRNEVRLAAPSINWDYAVIERLDPVTLKTTLISFDLGKLVIDHDVSQDLSLQAGDTITIFSEADIQVPIERQTKYVELAGEFVHAGMYSVRPGETLRDLVTRAGGFTNKAYLYGSEFTRESTRVLQQQRLDEYVRNVNAEAQRGTQALAVSGAATGAGAAEVEASRSAAQELVTRLSQIRATGRIVLKLKPASSSIDDVPAMSLENGDRFVVPFAPSTVNVVGAVYDQNSFLFESGRTTAYYLKLAGGPNRNADSHRDFIIRADGSVVSRAALNNLGFRSNSFNDVRLNPGDTIVVPDKVLRPTALRGVMDWTQVFSQLALGAAAINVL